MQIAQVQYRSADMTAEELSLYDLPLRYKLEQRKKERKDSYGSNHNDAIQGVAIRETWQIYICAAT